MKIQSFRTEIAQAVDGLQIPHTEVVINGKTLIEFAQCSRFREALDLLHQIGIRNPFTAYLMEVPIYKLVNEDVRVALDEGRTIIQNIQLLISVLTAVDQELIKFIPPPSPNSVVVHIGAVSDFQQLEGDANRFHKILTTSVLVKGIEGAIEIKHVESGSLDFEVFLGNPIAVAFIGRIMEKALKWLELKILLGSKKNFEKTAGEDSSVLKRSREASASETYDLMHKVIQRNLVKELESEFFDDTLPERTANLLKCTGMLSEEILKGNYILPPPNADKQVQKSFPKMADLVTIGAAVVKIAEKASQQKDKSDDGEGNEDEVETLPDNKDLDGSIA
jgi:hypothetical protein